MKKNKLISYSHLVPYFGSVIVFLGVTRLIFYYESFGIKITDYLEFSEILTSFLSILVIVLIYFGFSIIQTLLQTSKSEHESKKQLHQKIIIEKHFLKRLKLYVKYFDSMIFNFFGLCLVFLVLGIIEKNLSFHTFLVLFLCFTGFFFLDIIFKEVEVKHEQLKSDKINKMFSTLILNALLFVIVTIWFTYNEVKSVKDFKSTFGTTITLKDNTVLESDSCSYFIGKTQKFVFFYDESIKTSEIIPVSEIKRIQIKNGSFH